VNRREAAPGGRRLLVLAVDSDPRALERLERLLAQRAEVAAVLTARSGADALARMAEQAPDVVFLEVRLPDVEGTKLAAAIGRFSPRPEIVFVTSDGSAAVEAFELQAADFLLKPVSDDRLARSLERLRVVRHGVERRARERRRGGGAPAVTALHEHLIAVDGTVGGARRLIEIASVITAQAAGERVELVCQDGQHTMATTLAALEEQWHDQGFQRVHRSFLVNLRRIHELQPSVGGAVVLMSDGATVPVARRQLAVLKQRLGIEAAA
jgi:two-component system, LytTR family, response regulator LytT